MKGNMNQLLKQAQQMQQRLAQTQAKLAEQSAEGQAGGGMVTATVNGKHELLKIVVDKEVVDPEDIETLQDLIVAAVNVANENINRYVEEEMSKITGGMKIPGLF